MAVDLIERTWIADVDSPGGRKEICGWQCEIIADISTLPLSDKVGTGSYALILTGGLYFLTASGWRKYGS